MTLAKGCETAGLPRQDLRQKLRVSRQRLFAEQFPRMRGNDPLADVGDEVAGILVLFEPGGQLDGELFRDRGPRQLEGVKSGRPASSISVPT